MRLTERIGYGLAPRFAPDAKFIQIDIAAGYDDANALAFERGAVFQNGGQGHRGRGLHHDAQMLPGKFHRLDDLGFRGGVDLAHMV